MKYMPVVHFICGPTGSGKTTYAIALADRAKAVRFTIDEWMANLFVADRPPVPDMRWAFERTARIETQIWSVADTLLARGVDVVFDLGISRRDHRDRFRARASSTPASIKMHYLDVPRETRRARVRARNEQRSTTYAYEITDATFDMMEQWFELPSDDELYGAMIVCDS
jgi:predicted kinase